MEEEKKGNKCVREDMLERESIVSQTDYYSNRRWAWLSVNRRHSLFSPNFSLSYEWLSLVISWFKIFSEIQNLKPSRSHLLSIIIISPTYLFIGNYYPSIISITLLLLSNFSLICIFLILLIFSFRISFQTKNPRFEIFQIRLSLISS